MPRLSRPVALPSSARAPVEGAPDYVNAESAERASRAAPAAQLEQDRARDYAQSSQALNAERGAFIAAHPDIARKIGWL